jgi:peptide/nickel transport system permease protein
MKLPALLRTAVLSRLFKNKLVIIGTVIISVFILLAVLAPLLAPYQPNAQNIEQKLESPSWKHWMGTDEYGRDVFSRIIYGSRISISIGFVAVGISLLIGILLGAISGYFGGWVDQVIMRLVDVFLCIPTIYLILILVTLLGPNIINVMIVIGVTSWPGLCRMVRAEFLSLKQRDYVSAAQAIGNSNKRIIFRHILPNALAPVYVTATFAIAGAILMESGLSFLGFGVQPPTATWGNILTAGKDYIHSAWWLMFFPGVMITCTVLGYALLGDGLRDVLDPRLSGGENV